jgi:hypothetical protein
MAQYPPQRSGRRGPALIVVLLVIILLLAGAYLYRDSLSNVVSSAQPSCSLGVTGTSATLTIRGWSASQDCDDILAGRSNFLGSSFPPTNIYKYTGSPTTPIVCEMDEQGRHLIVRDEGSLKLAGNELCFRLRKQPTPVPSPTAGSPSLIAATGSV